MAGDWIKIRTALPRDSRVVRIASALRADRLRIVGALVSVWSLFDEQTEDGKLIGYTPEILDEMVGVPGLTVAMEGADWMVIGAGFLAIPRFDEHNGKSAKRRAMEADRKSKARKAEKCPQSMRTESGPEKRREEISNVSTAPGREAGELAEGESAFGGPSLGQAKAMAARAGIEERIAVKWWQSLEGVGWIDGQNRRIVAGDHLLAKYAGTLLQAEREKAANEKARGTSGRNFGTGPAPTVNVDKFAGRPVVTAAGADGLGDR